MVPSAWQERLKFGLTTPLDQWRPAREKADPRREWGWRTMDPASVAERWGASLAAGPRPRRHGAAASAATRDELWHRFAAACDLTATSDDLDLGVGLVNESLGVTAAELLRRVNERIGPPIEGSREQAKWLRDTLAHGVLARAGLRAHPDHRRPADRRRSGRPPGRSVASARPGTTYAATSTTWLRAAVAAARRRTSPTPSSSTPRWTRSCSSSCWCASARRAAPRPRPTPRAAGCAEPPARPRSGPARRTSGTVPRPASAASPSWSRSSTPTARCTCASPRCRTSSPSCCSRSATATPRSPARALKRYHRDSV